MQITDPIADMLTRIRNAGSAKHESVDVPASKMKTTVPRASSASPSSISPAKRRPSRACAV